MMKRKNADLSKIFQVQLDELGAPVSESESSAYQLVTGEIAVRRDKFGNLYCVEHNCNLNQCKDIHK